jgi:hypothetical protein
MKDCDTCGNEIPDASTQCPFCESRQSPGRRPAGPREQVRTINVEAGMPNVDEALVRLERELWQARQSGVHVIWVIHGWGSSGTGGRLRLACRAFLQREMTAGRVKRVIAGDDYSRTANMGRDLQGRCRDLRDSERSDRHNPGITFVEL